MKGFTIVEIEQNFSKPTTRATGCEQVDSKSTQQVLNRSRIVSMKVSLDLKTLIMEDKKLINTDHQRSQFKSLYLESQAKYNT